MTQDSLTESQTGVGPRDTVQPVRRHAFMLPTLFCGHCRALAWGKFPMVRPLAALVSGAVLIAAGLAGCTDNAVPPGQPSFYRDLAQPDAILDANAAQSMISGYRGNNGLGPVTIDPQLMQLAAVQAQIMAAKGKLDHDVGAPFQERI